MQSFTTETQRNWSAPGLKALQFLSATEQIHRRVQGLNSKTREELNKWEGRQEGQHSISFIYFTLHRPQSCYKAALLGWTTSSTVPSMLCTMSGSSGLNTTTHKLLVHVCLCSARRPTYLRETVNMQHLFKLQFQHEASLALCPLVALKNEKKLSMT